MARVNASDNPIPRRRDEGIQSNQPSITPLTGFSRVMIRPEVIKITGTHNKYWCLDSG